MKKSVSIVSLLGFLACPLLAAPPTLSELLDKAKQGQLPATIARQAAAAGLGFPVSNRDIHALQKAGFSPADIAVLGAAAPVDDDTALPEIGVYSFDRFNVVDPQGQTNVEGLPADSSASKVTIAASPLGVDALSCVLTYTDQVDEALPADPAHFRDADPKPPQSSALTSYLTAVVPMGKDDKTAAAVTLSEGEIRYPILDLPIANQRGEELVMTGVELEVLDAVLDAAPILEIVADEKAVRIVNRGWGAAKIDKLMLTLGRGDGAPDENAPRLEAVKQSKPRKIQVEAAGEVVVPLAELFPDVKVVPFGVLQDRVPKLKDEMVVEKSGLFVECLADYAGFTGLRRPPYHRLIRGPMCAALQAFLFEGMLAFRPIVAEGDLSKNLFIAFRLDPNHKGKTHSIPMNWRIAPAQQERILIGLSPERSGLYKLRLRIRFGANELLETRPKIVRLVRPSRKGYCAVSN